MHAERAHSVHFEPPNSGDQPRAHHARTGKKEPERECERSESSEQTPPSDLQTIIDVWPTLPQAMKQGILSIVLASEKNEGGKRKP